MIPKVITFRLSETEAKKLSHQAREVDLSSHKLARDIVLQGLSVTRLEEDMELIAQSIEELRQVSEAEVKALRISMVQGLAVLLAKQEDVEKQDAVEWLENKIRYGVD
jgi:predicted transcriptional regulator